MSYASAIAFQGLSKARKQLAELVAGLRDHQGVIDRTASKVGAQVQAVASQFLGRHVWTGHALDTQEVTVEGGLVLNHMPRYTDFVAGNSLRGRLPPFIVKRARDLFAAEFLAAIGEKGATGTMAAAVVADVQERAATRAAKRGRRG